MDPAPNSPNLIWRTLLIPPRWLMHFISLFAMAGILFTSSTLDFTFEFAFLFLCFLLIAIWLLRAALFRMANRRFARPFQSWKKTLWHWAVGPVLTLITLSLLIFNVPLRTRFAISQNALNQLAQKAVAAGPKPWDSHWYNAPVQSAGVFKVSIVQVTPSGQVYFRIPGSEFMRSFSGFAYSPNAQPDDPAGSFAPLTGPWYVWHTSW